MRVLGIDPGIAITGYGIIEENEKGDIDTITYGVFQTYSDVDLPSRLITLYKQIKQIIFLHKPDECAVEKLFFQKNVKTATAVGEARGVILLAFGETGLLTSEYSPNEIKQAVCGYGKADKNQIQQMVKSILRLDSIPKPDDAADALATAICHLSYSNYYSNIKQS